MKSPLFDTLTLFYNFCKKMCHMSHRGGKSRDPWIQDPFFSHICLEQKIYASQENFTQTLVVMVETFRRSGVQMKEHADAIIALVGNKQETKQGRPH